MLLKAVVQVIPTFAMGCFKLPLGLCQDSEKLIWKFWWGQRGERRNIHWKNWKTLCKLKNEGGLGFKDLAKFNDAMLTKQVWRLVHDKNSLFYHVFKSKYFPNGTIFEAKQSSGSFAWKGILKAQKIILLGAKWRVGDGQTIRIFEDCCVLKHSRSGLFLFVYPPKLIKHFLWRACTNCLPTKANLLKRKIVSDSVCHRCGRCEEDTMHALWDCEVIKLIW